MNSATQQLDPMIDPMNVILATRHAAGTVLFAPSDPDGSLRATYCWRECGREPLGVTAFFDYNEALLEMQLADEEVASVVPLTVGTPRQAKRLFIGPSSNPFDGMVEIIRTIKLLRSQVEALESDAVGENKPLSRAIEATITEADQLLNCINPWVEVENGGGA